VEHQINLQLIYPLHFVTICNCAPTIDYYVVLPEYPLFVVLLYQNNIEALLFHISVCHFERSFINNPGPCVLFATPGMISGGFSLEAFKKWAPSEKNLITLPGYTPDLSCFQHIF
jgi:Cft2 family RNA processing exonuclease